jgi:Nuclease subunit of the excinuclease complex
MDVIGIATDGNIHCVTVIFIRGGSILGSKNHFPKIKNCENKKIIQEGFILHHYFDIEPPSEIILSKEIYNKQWIQNSLKTKYRRKIKLNNNVRGNRLKWQELSNKNARSGLEYKLSVDSSTDIKLKNLGKLILNITIPNRMECIHISHISRETTVASCVVFDKNGPLKSDYRRYNIKTTQIGDDYAAMAEAIFTRYKKVKNKTEKKPDILFIDGG